MTWDVEYTDEFEEWWDGLSEAEQEDAASHVGLLEERGPQLAYPHSSGIASSKHSHMRELRVQHQGRRTGFSMRSIRGARRSCW